MWLFLINCPIYAKLFFFLLKKNSLSKKDFISFENIFFLKLAGSVHFGCIVNGCSAVVKCCSCRWRDGCCCFIRRQSCCCWCDSCCRRHCQISCHSSCVRCCVVASGAVTRGCCEVPTPSGHREVARKCCAGCRPSKSRITNCSGSWRIKKGNNELL